MSDTADKTRKGDVNYDSEEDDGKLEGARVEDQVSGGGGGGGATGGGATTASGGADGQTSPRVTFTHSLPVPEHKMGWIIGKAGVNITALSQKSGASISVSDSTNTEFGTKWNYIQITGTGRTVDRAKKLILLRLERLDSTSHDSGGGGRNYDQRPNYNNGGGGGGGVTSTANGSANASGSGSSSPRSPNNNRHYNLDHPGRGGGEFHNNGGRGGGSPREGGRGGGRGEGSPREGGRGGGGRGKSDRP